MKPSAEETFGYADATAGIFYEAFLDADFFTNGVLIITSDHRSMTPLAANEIDRFGLSASARVPLIIAGPMLETRTCHDGRFQQRDLPGSLAQLLAGENCQSTDTGNLFTKSAREPACILYPRGDRQQNGRLWLTRGLACSSSDSLKTALSGQALVKLGVPP